jgi:hypothetical protein
MDMDGIVSSDFRKVIENCRLKYILQYKGRLDRIPDIYKDLEPIEGAIKAVNKILENDNFETFFYLLRHGITLMGGIYLMKFSLFKQFYFILQISDFSVRCKFFLPISIELIYSNFTISIW